MPLALRYGRAVHISVAVDARALLARPNLAFSLHSPGGSGLRIVRFSSRTVRRRSFRDDVQVAARPRRRLEQFLQHAAARLVQTPAVSREGASLWWREGDSPFGGVRAGGGAGGGAGEGATTADAAEDGDEQLVDHVVQDGRHLHVATAVRLRHRCALCRHHAYGSTNPRTD